MRSPFSWEKELLTCTIFGFTPPPRWSPKFLSCCLFPLYLLLPFTHRSASKTASKSSPHSTWSSHWWSRLQLLWATSFLQLSTQRLLLSLSPPSWTCLFPYSAATWSTWSLSRVFGPSNSSSGSNTYPQSGTASTVLCRLNGHSQTNLSSEQLPSRSLTRLSTMLELILPSGNVSLVSLSFGVFSDSWLLSVWLSRTRLTSARTQTILAM